MSSPLPTREEAQAEWDKEGLYAADTMEWVVLEALASGRLVDREAIDHEAASNAIRYWQGRQIAAHLFADAVLRAALGEAAIT